MTGVDRFEVGTHVEVNGTKGYIVEIKQNLLFILHDGIIHIYDINYITIYICEESKVRILKDGTWVYGKVYFASSIVSIILNNNDVFEIVETNDVFSYVDLPEEPHFSDQIRSIKFFTYWEGEKYNIDIIKRLTNELVLVSYEDHYFDVIHNTKIIENVEDETMSEIKNDDSSSLPSLESIIDGSMSETKDDDSISIID